MKANTFKVEGKILSDLNKIKPDTQSLASFVREILEQAIRARKMREAASEYQAYLETDKEEQKGVDEWENADLENAPKRKKR